MSISDGQGGGGKKPLWAMKKAASPKKRKRKERRMDKNDFIGRRTKIISDMLDNPNQHGIYPTTKAFAALDDLFDELTGGKEGPSWAQIETEKPNG